MQLARNTSLKISACFLFLILCINRVNKIPFNNPKLKNKDRKYLAKTLRRISQNDSSDQLYIIAINAIERDHDIN